MRNAAIAATEPSLSDLADEDRLRAALEAAMHGASGGRAAVALRTHGGVAVASIGDAGGAAPIGCLAKLLTAALVRAAVHAGRVAFDDELGTLLGVEAPTLRRIRLRHLLEHTHGLDDAWLEPPRRERGFLDSAELLARAAALPRFAAPGRCYSYGHLGAWLAAVVLERVLARRYVDLAREWLRDALGARVTLAAGLCPALGTGLALAAAELVRVVAHAGAGPERWPSGDLPGTYGAVTPLPGWNPLERGVFLGWKHSGRSWFGHQSAWPGASAYVRAQPATGLAVAVLARTHAAAVIAARLFAAALPELFELRAPAPAEPRRDDAQWPGRYAHSALAVEIAAAAGGLALAARARAAPHGVRRARLLPAGGNVRIASPANEAVPFVELVPAPTDGETWLWNGRCLLRPCATLAW